MKAPDFIFQLLRHSLLSPENVEQSVCEFSLFTNKNRELVDYTLEYNVVVETVSEKIRESLHPLAYDFLLEFESIAALSGTAKADVLKISIQGNTFVHLFFRPGHLHAVLKRGTGLALREMICTCRFALENRIHISVFNAYIM